MLEVCFNDSVKGALAIAQNHTNIIGRAASVGFITDKKGIPAVFAKIAAWRQYRRRQRELQKAAVPLGGRREDIAGISLCLSQGDIKADIVPGHCPRKTCACEVFAFDRYNEHEDMAAAADGFWKACIQDMEKLRAAPEAIRIWLDSSPDARCGLLFVASMLRGGDTEIRVVELPEQSASGVREYRCWGDVEPQLYGTYLPFEHVLTKDETEALALEWERLLYENSALRAVENGRVVSADISCYDERIRKEFPADTCTVAYIIGKALGRQVVLTSDVFIAKRIRHFIDTGELCVTDKGKNGFYGMVVKRSQRLPL